MHPAVLAFDPPPVSVLYVPGSKDRALEKARGLPADMLIIDLEDAVPEDQKAAARRIATEAIRSGFPGKKVALRVNGVDTPHHAADLAVLAAVRPDAVVLPKVEGVADIDALACDAELPVLSMVETPAGIYAARDIAAHPRVLGLIAGLNDLAHALRLPDGRDRDAMSFCIQSIVLAARAAGKLVFDGVWNAIDDHGGMKGEAWEAYRLGFDGKTLIHPGQVDICNATFAATPEELAEAEALIAAATGGAERFEGRMIEDMHVKQAMRMVAIDKLRTARRSIMRDS